MKMNRFACSSCLFPLTISHLFIAESQCPGCEAGGGERTLSCVNCFSYLCTVYAYVYVPAHMYMRYMLSMYVCR